MVISNWDYHAFHILITAHCRVLGESHRHLKFVFLEALISYFHHVCMGWKGVRRGSVFCYETIKELNIKTKNWKELLTDEPFTRDDLITIQNPNELDTKKALAEFDHVKKGLKIDDEGIIFV
ncbi:peptidyl-prolyl cis-trans isomerase CYP65-like [Chenopodium quinoa]|uniref:peptidyl-prolyl cis-trans isomerase CYP65-like n=1 Tax=Chenopodium quinoa TaxID=63459 RepID=UPI000B77056C|nr:peptidyl-prolyl cis-trans isomerase CYP65-like [Chenopodium quinoa]